MAIEAQRRQQIIDEQRRREQQLLDDRRRAQQAVILEQKRQQSEIEAQRRLETDRREAQARAEEQRRVAQQADQAARQKATAEAEARKKTADALRPAARQLVEDASEFVKTNPSNALSLVRQIAALNSNLNESDPDKLQSFMQTLVSSLREHAEYLTFEQKRGEQKREEANRQLSDFLKIAGQQSRYIDYYAKNHVTAPATLQLLPLIDRLSAAIALPQLDDLRQLTNEVELVIRKAGLADDFARTKDVLGQAEPRRDLRLQQSALHTTAKNKFLFDGDPDDFVLLYNSSDKAPHVVLTIKGEFDFEGAKSKACLYQSGFDRDQPYLVRRALQAHKLRPEHVDVDQAECNRSDLAGYDIIATDRGAFQRLRPDVALLLLSEIEKDHFKLFSLLTHEDREQGRRARQQAIVEIKRAIDNEAKNGFGIIIENASVPVLCYVVASLENGHRRWLNENADGLSLELRYTSTEPQQTIAKAYIAVERSQCGAVYASASDLKEYAAALKRQNKEYTVASLWASNDEVGSLDKAAKAEEYLQLQRDQEQKRAADARREIERLQAADERNRHDNRQRELRSKYAKIAAAVSAAIANQVREGFDSTGDWQATAAFKQFPSTIYAYQNFIRGRWELQSFNSDVFEYGTAEWGGRSVEAGFTEVNVRMRNRIEGRYRDLCYIFGRINDAEFAMTREWIETSCTDHNRLDEWRRRNKFSSLWNAE